jgi:hypothetical protein
MSNKGVIRVLVHCTKFASEVVRESGEEPGQTQCETRPAWNVEEKVCSRRIVEKVDGREEEDQANVTPKCFCSSKARMLEIKMYRSNAFVFYR